MRIIRFVYACTCTRVIYMLNRAAGPPLDEGETMRRLLPSYVLSRKEENITPDIREIGYDNDTILCIASHDQ